ncbi:MAG: 2-iminoacetate synthase ThiH [Planctomycetota bacterium]
MITEPQAPLASLAGRALAEAGWEGISRDLDARLAGVTNSDVEREMGLAAERFSLERLLVFLSPAARERLEDMAAQAHALTLQRFGRTMRMYAPLYLSNHCVNFCRYCGFNASHRVARRRLSLEEALDEARALSERGFRDILLVSGEDREHVSPEYLSELALRLRERFASIAIEVHPLDEPGYARLAASGVDGLTLYQETYDRARYALFHPRGPKADYEARLEAPERAARAGMRRLGIGALLGLSDWRRDAVALAIHARALMRRFWRTQISFSFPRVRPAPGVSLPELMPVSDRDLVQMILSLRLSFPDAGMALSTREEAALRDRLIPLGVTQMSAGSRTFPGGYVCASGAAEQFDVCDTRSPETVSRVLASLGYEPVWKDWDAGFLKDSPRPRICGCGAARQGKGKPF